MKMQWANHILLLMLFLDSSQTSYICDCSKADNHGKHFYTKLALLTLISELFSIYSQFSQLIRRSILKSQLVLVDVEKILKAWVVNNLWSLSFITRSLVESKVF